MTQTRLDLIAALFQIQCHPLFKYSDIVTAAGNPKVSDDQVRNHIDGCMKAIARAA